MPSLALVALLSGARLTGTPDGDRDKDKGRADTPAAEASAVEASEAPADPRAITNMTYAFGRPSDLAPIKAWVAYGWGEAETPHFRADGEDASDAQDFGDIVTQRLHVGAQINFLNFPAFKVGAGGELIAGQNKFQGTPLGDLESEFGLQQVSAFVTLRGRVVGIHGGYHFDLADEVEANPPSDEFPLSDGRNALFVGGDFDYPSERFRLFGGIDYIMRQDDDDAVDGVDGNNIIWWNMGAGVRFGFVEIGGALMIRTTLVRGEAFGASFPGTTDSGGHLGTIAPYLKVAPPSLPVSLFVKGALHDEYTDVGYALGGANDFKPSLGFTAGLTLGFN